MTDAFCGTFRVEEIDSAIDLDAVIIGAPFEDSSGYPSGAVLAPAKIRVNSEFFSGQSLFQQSIHQLNVVDFGDVSQWQSYKELQEKLAEKVAKTLEKNALPVVLGGDHSIALGTANGIMKSEQEIDGIIWIDAHLDLMDEYPENDKFSRATVLRRITELELVDPSDIFFIGCRGHNLGWEEVEFVQEKGMQTLLAQEAQLEGRLTKFLEKVTKDRKNLYVSLDIDVLDPAFAPGVSVPEPGGLSSRELFVIIRQLAKSTKCLEVVEVNPNLDINDLTSKVACKVIFEQFDSL